MTDKAKSAMPYVQRLLNDQEAQERIGQALRSCREAYGRARDKDAAEAIGDRKFQRRIFESLGAAREAWVAVEQPTPPRKRRLLPALIVLILAGIGVTAMLRRQRREDPLPVSPDDETARANDSASGVRSVPVAESAGER
jgi:hypothetical protein